MNIQLLRTDLPQPISKKNIIRFLIVVIFILSFLAGYYQLLYKQEQKKYLRLEDNYVRVRSVLGREETQRLIDSTYEDRNN